MAGLKPEMATAEPLLREKMKSQLATCPPTAEVSELETVLPILIEKAPEE